MVLAQHLLALVDEAARLRRRTAGAIGAMRVRPYATLAATIPTTNGTAAPAAGFGRASEEVPLWQLAAMADDGRITDMKTLLLIQTLRLREPDLFG